MQDYLAMYIKCLQLSYNQNKTVNKTFLATVVQFKKKSLTFTVSVYWKKVKQKMYLNT